RVLHRRNIHLHQELIRQIRRQISVKSAVSVRWPVGGFPGRAVMRIGIGILNALEELIAIEPISMGAQAAIISKAVPGALANGMGEHPTFFPSHGDRRSPDAAEG